MSEKPSQHLLAALSEASHRHGMKRIAACDATGTELSYRSLWIRSFVLAGALEAQAGKQRYVGMLLPTSLPALVTFIALQLLGRVPAMLNFSAGSRNLLAACNMAEVDTVITARAFVEKAKLEEQVAALVAKCRIIYLEDVRKSIGWREKLSAVLRAALPRFPAAAADEPAVVLFTSGSEGLPKGVALSHANLLSNIGQVMQCVTFTHDDIMLNPLPVFHSFGLTAGMLLPLLAGVKVVLYPSPLHYHIVPEMCRKSRATVFLGTDTFYNGYARAADKDDFRTVRLGVAGAEKLREPTRQLFKERFGMEIFQGYGVTEASPVVSVNTPDEHRPGTVGRVMPGMECRLEKMEGIARGGRLFIKGPNVMLGYLRADRPGIIQPHGEWYDTGDIVDIDADGFITILGRAKRFAKVGGEMVSLAAVEECAAMLWPERGHAALAMQDARKGEQVLLVTEQPDATREVLLKYMQQQGASELMAPRRVQFMETLPRLGNGKVDYMALSALPLTAGEPRHLKDGTAE